MLPTLVDAPPEGDDCHHEIKQDGYRTELLIEQGIVRAFSRPGHDWTAKYPNVVDAARALACESAIIDGEIIIQERRGRSDYQALRRSVTKGQRAAFVFIAFDLLHLDGEDLRRLPLDQRRTRLRALLGDAEGQSMASANTR
jgi:ATP-dependent DNA ligase